jgi:rhodanese-related sulfurtransferase
MVIVDIQPAVDFEQHHLPGSIETRAFPAVKDEEKARLDKAMPAIKSSNGMVVVVCPRGKSGALNSYKYFVSKGISEDRLRILEDGVAEWPYKDLMVKGR